MRAVLLSIRPEWVELIAKGKKTIEVRKTRPKLKTPFKCYIYCTKSGQKIYCRSSQRIGNGMVIGEFVCDRVFDIEYEEGEGYNEGYTPLGFSDCLSDDQFDGYLRGENGYGWHITNLVIYDQPKHLTDFKRPCKNAFYCESCAMYKERSAACGNAALEITHPPQSYMEVVMKRAREAV